jgi:hypothetical protein
LLLRGLLAACLLLAACSALPTGTPSSTALPQSEPGSGESRLCTVLTLDDVRAKSPFQTPLAKAGASNSGDKCEYSSDEDAGDQVSIVIEVARYPTAKKAKSAIDDARQAAVDHGLPVTDVDDLGDSAFASGVDEVSVRAVGGDKLISATLQGEWPDTTDDAKIAAGTELVRTVISRLP